MSEHDFSIQYRKEMKYQNADALSQINSKTLTILYHQTYLMNINTYQNLINYLTMLIYSMDYNNKRKIQLRKNSTQYFIKNHTLYKRNKKITYK